MKLEIKNLHSEVCSVECDGDDTIKQLKEKIAAKKEWKEKYDPELLKLLYTGKVMDDEETVNSYAIKPDGFVVLVKQTPGKPKPPPKKKPNQGFNNQMGGFGSNSFMQPFQQNSFGHQPFQQSPFGQNSFQQSSFGENAFQQPAFNQNAFQQPTFGQNASQQNQFGAHFPATGTASGLADTAPDAFSTAEDREEALQALLAMGFDKAQSEQALRASFYNVETAIEYITSGNIPAVKETPVIPQGTGAAKPSGSLISPPSPPNPPTVRHQGGGGGMGTNLQQMRQMLQNNPEQLQVLKQTLQAEHPEIAQMIDENPQAFLELLNQAGGNDEGGPAAGVGGGGGAAGQGQGAISVSLSAPEQQIITRLQEMGFDRNRAIEAFLACDRNENLAINYLLNFD